MYNRLKALAHCSAHQRARAYWNRWRDNDVRRSVKIMTDAGFGTFALEYEDGRGTASRARNISTRKCWQRYSHFQDERINISTNGGDCRQSLKIFARTTGLLASPRARSHREAVASRAETTSDGARQQQAHRGAVQEDPAWKREVRVTG